LNSRPLDPQSSALRPLKFVLVRLPWSDAGLYASERWRDSLNASQLLQSLLQWRSEGGITRSTNPSQVSGPDRCWSTDQGLGKPLRRLGVHPMHQTMPLASGAITQPRRDHGDLDRAHRRHTSPRKSPMATADHHSSRRPLPSRSSRDRSDHCRVRNRAGRHQGSPTAIDVHEKSPGESPGLLYFFPASRQSSAYRTSARLG
jgi:hypothetical protein